MATAGLRERKKQQTRQHIFDSARRLFAARGFERVTVAEIAEAADVSEVTVFNYFPTKEDLFYAGMQFYEEQLVEAVRQRPAGDTPLKAVRRKVVEDAARLAERARIDSILKSTRAVASSPALAAREREIVERYTRRLAEVLAAEAKADPDDVEPLAVAAALLGAHRAVVEAVRIRVLAGLRGEELVDEARRLARRAFARLERGLGDYAIMR